MISEKMDEFFKICLPLFLYSCCSCEHADSLSAFAPVLRNPAFRVENETSILRATRKSEIFDVKSAQRLKTPPGENEILTTICLPANTSCIVTNVKTLPKRFANLSEDGKLFESETSSIEKIFESEGSSSGLHSEPPRVNFDDTSRAAGKADLQADGQRKIGVNELFSEDDKVVESENSSIEKIFESESSTVEVSWKSRLDVEGTYTARTNGRGQRGESSDDSWRVDFATERLTGPSSPNGSPSEDSRPKVDTTQGRSDKSGNLNETRNGEFKLNAAMSGPAKNRGSQRRGRVNNRELAGSHAGNGVGARKPSSYHARSAVREDSSTRGYTRKLFQTEQKLYFQIEVPQDDDNPSLSGYKVRVDPSNEGRVLNGSWAEIGVEPGAGARGPGMPDGKTGKGGKGRGKQKRKDSKRKKSVMHPNGLFGLPETPPGSGSESGSGTHLRSGSGRQLEEGRKSRRRMQDSGVVTSSSSSSSSSLAFVFDSTGSMWDDLTQVKQGAVKILETIRHRNPTLIADYILVPFQDPVVGPLTVSTDHEEFLRRLQEIEVFSGGDCPEMTLSALILALQACRPHSFVYVFTDARSKDYERVNELLPLIQKKQTQVVFVMTGDCGDPQHPGYQVFEKIAATSSGQVYHLNKTDVQEVLNFVRVSLQSHKVNLLAVDSSNQNVSSTEEHELPVDQTLKEFTVAVAGIHPTVQVTNPAGELPKNLTSLLDLENVKIVNVKQPDPGIWRVNVKSDAQYTIRSTGLSSIDFSYGFSVKPAKTLIETSHRPLKGTENSILIQTEPRNILNLTTVCFLNVNGEILQNVTLEPLTSKKGVYSSEPFTPTGDYFYVSINGFSKNGTPLKRITPTAISPQLPAVPEIQPPSNYTGLIHQDITLKCHVESLVPFSVRWFKDNKAMGRNVQYLQTAEAEWKLIDLKKEDEGVYACQAKNAAGFATQRIYVSVRGNPPFVKTAEHVVGTPDLPTVLECEVESLMIYNVTWFQGITGETRYWKEIRPNSKFTVGNENQLILNPTFESDAGWYQCIAQNSAGSGIGKLYLSVKEEPKISIEPRSVKVTQNDFFTLKCFVVRGTPKPKLLWKKEDLPISDGLQGKYQLEQTENSSILRVDNVQSSDAGLYTCHAVNDVNIITSQIYVEYVEKPNIYVENSYQSSKEGELIRLKCQASGFPQPDVSWLKDGQPLEKNSNLIQIKDDLTILSVKLSDSGVYTCLGRNSEGQHSGSITLQVGTPPRTQTTGNSIDDNISTVDMGGDIEFHCLVNGSPDPTIVWTREGNPSFLESERFQISNDSVVLKIIGTSLEDEGHYTCEAENIFGKTTLEFLLKLTGTEAPKFMESSQDENILQIAPGEKAYLSCSLIGGKPKPSVLWYHNEFPINTEHSRFQQHENGSLTISKIEKFDGGTYICVATNPIGSIKKVFKLQTYEPPKFEENLPSRFQVLAEEDTTIPCKFVSEPKGTVTWQKDGRLLTLGGRFSLHEDSLRIQQTLLEDKGTYVCTVVNPAGSASRAIALDVLVKPTILDNHETNITLQEGEDYKIPCSAMGTPNPDIKWKRMDKTYSAGYHDEEIFVLADNSLILSSVTVKMSGNYECLAENKGGSDSRLYSLTVIVPEPPLEVHDVPVINVEVLESDVALLECPLPSSSPPEWQKDGTELDDLHNERADEAHFVLMDRQRKVRISESRISDSGDYTCQVENNDLNSDTAIVRLNVVGAPSFEQEIYEPDITVVEGEKLVLNCMVRGNPQPKVQWRFLDNDTPITEYTFPGVYFEQAFKQNLVVQRANHSRHGGHYQCSATNKLSTQTRDFHVKVLRAPVIKESSVEEDIKVNSQNLTILKCSISSDPTPEITWLLNNTNISPQPKIVFEKLDNDFNTYFLSVNISRTSVGRYTCFASNKAGIAEKHYSVTLG